MEATNVFLPQARSLSLARRRPAIVAVLTRPPTDNIAIEKFNVKPAHDNKTGLISTEKQTVYNDSWFDKLALNHLSQSVQATTGLRNELSGFDSLVEAASAVSRNFNPIQQRELVIQALDKAFPRPIMSMIQTMLPNSKLAREFFAVFTTVFFAWLVGPCEVRESEFNGSIEKNVVHINKCRFLETSNCAGMCTNMCMIPSQTFIKNSLGVPVNMVPNFDDMSCEMIYGQEPPTPADDPAFKQPCYKLCKASKKKHSLKCTS